MPSSKILTRECIEINCIPEPNCGCWLWTGFLNAQGYGILRRLQINHRAHVASYKLFVGEFTSTLFIRHLCHVRSCVNPEHLRPGTQKENMQDSVLAGRTRSEKFLAAHKARRLMTDGQIDEAKDLYKKGMTHLQISELFGVSRQTIQGLC